MTSFVLPLIGLCPMADLSVETAKPDYSAGHVRGYFPAAECAVSPVSSQVEVIRWIDTSPTLPRLEDVDAFFETTKVTAGDYVQDINYLRNYSGSKIIAQFNVYFWAYSAIDVQYDYQGTSKNSGFDLKREGFPCYMKGKTCYGISRIDVAYAKGKWSLEKETAVGSLATDKFYAGVLWAHPHPNVFRHFVLRYPSTKRCWYAMRSCCHESAVLETATQTVTEV